MNFTRFKARSRCFSLPSK